ncbi:MAG: hypothetical protein KDC98_02525 [Planctomycetes bacterium]|nr:hypothetical protein [Planctomycetota bacterium]
MNDPIDLREFDEAAGTWQGRAFPSESEWLELGSSPAPLPARDHDPHDPIEPDFVARVMAALSDPTPEQLATFAPPPPSPDFVARTASALQHDRRERWRELMARYVAPDPSPAFVARTLRALRESREDAMQGHRRRSAVRAWIMPLLAAAAVLIVFVSTQREVAPPIEMRAVEATPAAFGPADAASPLPALLMVLDRRTDPTALPDCGACGIWLLLQQEQQPQDQEKGR